MMCGAVPGIPCRTEPRRNRVSSVAVSWSNLNNSRICTNANYRRSLPIITVHAGQRNAESLRKLFANTPIAFTRVKVVTREGNTTLNVATPALRFVKTGSINNRVFTNNRWNRPSWSVVIGMSKLVEFKNFVKLSKAFYGRGLAVQQLIWRGYSQWRVHKPPHVS